MEDEVDLEKVDDRRLRRLLQRRDENYGDRYVPIESDAGGATRAIFPPETYVINLIHRGFVQLGKQPCQSQFRVSLWSCSNCLIVLDLRPF